MSKQYYENNDMLESNEQIITYYYKRSVIELFSDAGVFSKTGVDFGSSLLIKTVEIPGNITKILDIGCGYGPIGLTLAKANPLIRVHLVDINKRAVALALKNAAHNKIKNVEVWESNLYENVDGKYDLILTNPPIRAGKQIVHAIFEGAVNYLRPTGSLWIVIQKKQGAPSAIKKLETLYKTVEIITTDKGYWIIKASNL